MNLSTKMGVLAVCVMVLMPSVSSAASLQDLEFQIKTLMSQVSKLQSLYLNEKLSGLRTGTTTVPVATTTRPDRINEFRASTTRATVTFTSPAQVEALTFSPDQVVNLGWSTTGTGFDEYRLFIGNRLTHTERPLFGKTGVVGDLPVTQTSYAWTVPSLLAEFGGGSLRRPIHKGFYIEVALVNGDKVLRKHSTKDRIAFHVPATQSTSSISSITLLQPNGGETLKQRTPYTIKWKTERLDDEKVTIYLVGNNGLFSKTIVENIKNTGFYEWTPSAGTPAGTYRIVVESSNRRPKVQDSSDATFTLIEVGSAIPVVTPNPA